MDAAPAPRSYRERFRAADSSSERESVLQERCDCLEAENARLRLALEYGTAHRDAPIEEK